MSTESPTPILPRGAGGPLTRAAGRGSGPVALVLEPDALARLLVLSAVAALGFIPVEETPAYAWSGGKSGDAGRAVSAAVPTTVFVPLERLPDCRRAGREVVRQALAPCTAAPADGALRGAAASSEQRPLLVGYGAGPEVLLAAHRAHRCCDLVLRLTAGRSGEPELVHLRAADPVAAAGLSLREADVLVLLLQGFTTPAVAARLSVAPSTARSHCRAVLRKLGARDRRGLRALLVGSPPAGGARHWVEPHSERRPVEPPSEKRPVEPHSAGHPVRPRITPRRGLVAPAPRFDEGGVPALPRNGP